MMNPVRIVEHPDKVMVLSYEPGLMIRCHSHLLRDKALPALQDTDITDQLKLCGKYLVSLGLASSEDDLLNALKEFSQCDSLTEAVQVSVGKLGLDVHASNSRASGVLSILARIIEDQPTSNETTLFCHSEDQATLLHAGKTYFGFVLQGNADLMFSDGRRYPLYDGEYFSIANEASISGNAKIVLIAQDRYLGYQIVGGLVPRVGHLRYIDGCTDSLLVPPIRLGDPCLNALFFPPNTDQTQHFHPSVRVGVVMSGRGVCLSEGSETALTAGKLFVIPAESWHSFRTSRSESAECAMSVLAFHPDSDFGPTDEEHPMINRTFTRVIHLLRSSARKLVMPHPSL